MSGVSEECVPVDDVISGLTPEQIEVGLREAITRGTVSRVQCVSCALLCVAIVTEHSQAVLC